MSTHLPATTHMKSVLWVVSTHVTTRLFLQCMERPLECKNVEMLSKLDCKDEIQSCSVFALEKIATSSAYCRHELFS